MGSRTKRMHAWASKLNVTSAARYPKVQTKHAVKNKRRLKTVAGIIEIKYTELAPTRIARASSFTSR